MTESTPAGIPLFFRFQEEKAADAATRLLRQSGGRMTRLVLIKLLYFAEREAAKRHNRPICGGRYVSMDNGPVLSEVYNLLKGERPSRIWTTRVASRGRDVILLEDHLPAAVSEAELEVLDAIYDEWGSQTVGKILKHAHEDLAEWENPYGSSLLIKSATFLDAVGKTEQEILDIVEEVREENYFHQLFTE